MLQTNLATRPIYNERLIHLLLLVAGLLVVALTALNVTAIVRLSRQASELEGRAGEAERQASEMERQATVTQRESGGPELEGLALAAREANVIIDKRLFSWTEFFNRIEANIPAGVMVTAIRPSIDRGGIMISLAVVGREVEGLDRFIEQLESTGAFSSLLSRQEEATDDGMYRAVIEGRYAPSGAAAPVTEAPGVVEGQE